MGIRELLDNDSPDTEEPSQVSEQESNPVIATSNLTMLLHSDSPCFVEPTFLNPPSTAEQFALLNIYRHRIDSILKVTHVPALRNLILDSSPPGQPHDVLAFSVYFAAACSLNDAECVEMLGAERNAIIAHFQYGAEAYLSSAGLLTTTDWRVLQAFIVYLIGRRICDGPRSIRALIAMAIRLGQSLGLDAGNVGGLTLDVEMPRRIWWSLGVLDLQAAFDAGMRPVLAFTTFTDVKPLNVDADLRSGQPEVFNPRKLRFTDMTFAVMTHAMLRSMRMLTHVPVDFDGRPHSGQSWTARLAIAHDTARQIRDQYLSCCDPTIPFQRFTSVVGESMIVTLQLLVRRPMHRSCSPKPPPDDDYNVFAVALNAVEQGLQKRATSTFNQWAWFTWSKWYALASLLTDMCRDASHGGNTHAWNVAEIGYTRYGETVDEIKLRVALRKLMVKAQSVRMTSEGLDKAGTIIMTPAQASLPSTCSREFGYIDGISTAQGQEPVSHMATSSSGADTAMTIDWDAFLLDIDYIDHVDPAQQCS